MNISYEFGVLRVDHRTGAVQFVPLLLLLLPIFWYCSAQMAAMQVLAKVMLYTILYLGLESLRATKTMVLYPRYMRAGG